MKQLNLFDTFLNDSRISPPRLTKLSFKFKIVKHKRHKSIDINEPKVLKLKGKKLTVLSYRP